LISLTKKDIVRGLVSLGLESGDKVLMHSSFVALGKVEGSPNTVIDALLEVLGKDGLLVMPTFSAGSPFNRKNAPTGLGVIPDAFWRLPGVVRSLHPSHSVAAMGPGAEGLIRDHENAPTAYGEGTPYFKLAMGGGKVLLLGVDQDRNTTLHAAEAAAGAPYLKNIEGIYIDDNGDEVKIPIAAMAGPHRDFIGLDKLFREKGIMRIGRIGRAACRLMDGEAMLLAAIEALQKDPAAVLCNNPACWDCVRQRGQIKAARLLDECFTLAAVAGDISEDWEDVHRAILGEGISILELTAEEYERWSSDLTDAGISISAIRGGLKGNAAAKLAESLGVPFIVPASCEEDMAAAAKLPGRVIVENTGACSAVYKEAYNRDGMPEFAFNPAQFAAVGEKPFLRVFYRGTLRKHTVHFYLDDGLFNGTPTLPGQGNGEVKEIISMLRCRGYNGAITLRARSGGIAGFRAAASAFWYLLDNI
jgi:aminoglycoside 3-N-acetyltransferase